MSTDEELAGSDGQTAPSGSETSTLPFDVTKANQARIYDYMLGGKDNYAADRAYAAKAAEVYPDVAFTAQANRAFLGRAVRFLAGEAGMRQFLDIGTGIPTAGNVHQVAQAAAPESRVLYVDYDPIVLAHARTLLNSAGQGKAEYVQADLRDTGKILDEAGRFLDLAKPVAITLVSILHAIPDADDPHAIVARLLDAVPSGSYLAFTHMGSDLLEEKVRVRMAGLLADGAQQQQMRLRDRVAMERFLNGTDPVDPGLVRVEQWRPEPGTENTAQSFLWGVVARKR
jgi:hypothetical protein